MSMGCTYKFFGFYISYTILTLPLSIFYLPFMLLIPCTFSPSLPLTPLLITLHVISISVIQSSDLLCTAGGSVNGAAAVETSMAVP